MANTEITIGSLCAGVGLLDVGVSVALAHLGYRAQPAFMCEWEAYAATMLIRHMENEVMEPCPVWCGDLADFDGNPWRGSLDLLIAGMPCQPYSTAGRQRGNEDQRAHGDGSGPVPQAARIIAECLPSVVFFENVPAWVRGGHFRAFGEELSRLGYRIASPLFARASSVGASHRRERVFVMAHREVFRREGLWQRENRHWGAEPDGRGRPMADTSAAARWQEASRSRQAGGTVAGWPGPAMGDTGSTRPQGARRGKEHDGWARTGPADRMCDLFAPGPSDDAWRVVCEEFPHLAPAVEPGVRFVVDGCPVVVDTSRADQLRCAGNAVVPLQAAAAFVELFDEVTSNGVQ